jgi:hypothetical protein
MALQNIGWRRGVRVYSEANPKDEIVTLNGVKGTIPSMAPFASLRVTRAPCLGRTAEAEKNLRWSLDVTDPAGRLDPTFYARFGRLLVMLLVDQRRWDQAEPLALRVLAIQDSLKDTLARASAEQLVKIYEGTGRHDLAAKYLKRSSP